jgi:hypothetical protein
MRRRKTTPHTQNRRMRHLAEDFVGDTEFNGGPYLVRGIACEVAG